jgi:hypothetical protein
MLTCLNLWNLTALLSHVEGVGAPVGATPA